MLSNTEIQSLVQVIGTGIGEEFDIAKLRYHRIIVMTDADVDGAHIRTLILTFLYRHMPELFDRGHVYIAVPPLYLVKHGDAADLPREGLAARGAAGPRDRFPQLEIAARAGESVKLTEARYGRFQRALAEFDGWSARLRSDFGASAADFLVGHRLVETEAATPAELATVLETMPANGHTFSVTASSADETELKVIETETSTALNVRSTRASCSPRRSTRTSAGRTARLGDVVGGLPPFDLKLGKKGARATTFDALRHQALDLAKEGLQISRFKGLGEMNYGQLWDTTMDPERRMLIRVDVEDASAADLWFSRLMGDQVEPRREFIEQNATDVRFLDV